MFVRAIVLVASLVSLTTACAQENPAAAASYVEGQHYYRIDPPQPTNSGDKVEVLEVFSYACSHCGTFQPFVDNWKANGMPAEASMNYMPAVFSPAWEPYARAFYTAEVMGVLDKTHSQLFQALHVQRRPLRSLEDLAGFYAEQGVDREQFLSTAKSFAVETKLNRSRQQVPRYQVEGTPSMIVAGKFRVTGESAGGYENLFKIVNFLVAQEHASSAKP